MIAEDHHPVEASTSGHLTNSACAHYTNQQSSRETTTTGLLRRLCWAVIRLAAMDLQIKQDFTNGGFQQVTYCIIVRGVPFRTGTTGAIVVKPMSAS